MADSQDAVEYSSTQDTIDAINDKEIGVIVTALRPDDESSSLISQPKILDAVARLKCKMFQLIRAAETRQTQATTNSTALHSNNVYMEKDDRHGTGEAKAQKDYLYQTRPMGEDHDESQKLCSDVTNDTLRNDRPSLMLRKFMAAEANAEEAQADWSRREAAILQGEEEKRHGKEWYFFYGSLMDPQQLRQVLGLREPPRDFRPAEIVGYHVRMWGPYPVLLDGPPGNVVKGVAYEIEGGEHKDKLARYETSYYREHNCIIQFSADENVMGTTFEWAGDESELREGTFDLKDWQMGRLLDN